MDPSTPSQKANLGGHGSNHRLLYRGALALPDSHLLLDGLSFVAETTGSAETLLENQLALALESMRGRPALHLLGTENLTDVWLDATNDISVYIHAYSTLSQVYFENVLCVDPITSPEKRTNIGIRCGLGDGSDPATTDFLIYGQLIPMKDHDNSTPSSSDMPPHTLQMFAARILPGPPQPAPRAPRPDDPTPRKPPGYTANAAKRKRESSYSSLGPGDAGKRLKANSDEDEQVRRAREVMLYMPKAGAADATGLKRAKSCKNLDTFKVPQLPARGGSMDSIPSASGVDVFGQVETASGKGKHKEVAEAPGSSELEKANKTVIKQATIACLSKYGINKAHSDFNDLYQNTYRGVCFALRSIMRMQAVAMRTVDRLVQDHLRMYLRGNGENHPK